MIITATERQSFKRCRRAWSYGSFNGMALARIVPKSYFSIGTMIHETHCRWLMDYSLDPVNLFLTEANKVVDKIKADYSDKIGASISDEELDPTYEQVKLGMAMMDNYKKMWKTPLSHPYKVVMPEQEIEIPIPGTSHVLQSRLDAVIKDSRSGLLYVLEHKTYGSRPRVDNLVNADQFLAYTWMLCQLGIGKVGGVAYDGMWKRPVPPKGSKFEDLFLRLIITYNSNQLDEFEKNLALEANEMANDPPLYINRRWEGCFDCNFQNLCSAQSRGEDVDYIIRTEYTRRERYDGEGLTANSE